MRWKVSNLRGKMRFLNRKATNHRGDVAALRGPTIFLHRKMTNKRRTMIFLRRKTTNNRRKAAFLRLFATFLRLFEREIGLMQAPTPDSALIVERIIIIAARAEREGLKVHFAGQLA